MIRYRGLNEKHTPSRRRILRENLESVVSDYFVREVGVNPQQDDRIRTSLKLLLTSAEGMAPAFVKNLREEYPEVSDIKVSDWKAEDIDRYVCKVSYKVPNARMDQGLKIACDVCVKCGLLNIRNYDLWNKGYAVVKTMTVGGLYVEYDGYRDEITFMVRLNMNEVNKLA